MKYLILLLSCSLIMSCTSYSEKLKKEIINELESNTETLTKGNGYYFYDEPISIGGEKYYKHHSTLDCPEIKNGVQRDCHKINAYNNLFCSHCMDDALITLWNDRVFPDGYKKK